VTGTVTSRARPARRQTTRPRARPVLAGWVRHVVLAWLRYGIGAAHPAALLPLAQRRSRRRYAAVAGGMAAGGCCGRGPGRAIGSLIGTVTSIKSQTVDPHQINNFNNAKSL
jgi:hypothetical protein